MIFVVDTETTRARVPSRTHWESRRCIPSTASYSDSLMRCEKEMNLQAILLKEMPCLMIINETPKNTNKIINNNISPWGTHAAEDVAPALEENVPVLH